MATILCVEDECAIRQDIAELIESSGHVVHQAVDGQEGLEMILKHQPDLVVSDISMPRKNGYDLLRDVRDKHPELARMPFIFLSALSDRRNVLDGMALGADEYLTKPVDYEMLEHKIEASLRQVERIKRQSDQELLKLFNKLSGDADRRAKPGAGADDGAASVEPAAAGGDRTGSARQATEADSRQDQDLEGGQLNDISSECEIPRETLANLLAVTQALYEPGFVRQFNRDLSQWSTAVHEEIQMIRSDEMAPSRLIEAIKRRGVTLDALEVRDNQGRLIPLRMFDLDDASRALVKSSFALFDEENLFKGQYFIDIMHLSLLARRVSCESENATLVVDVHYQTLTTPAYLESYLSAFDRLGSNTAGGLVVNVMNAPASLSSADFERALIPLGENGIRRTIQVTATTAGALAKSPLPVSAVIWPYSEVMPTAPDPALIKQAKLGPSESRILTIVRGLPSERAISKLRKHGFDGYAVSAS